MSAWYIAHDDELLMDLDDCFQIAKSGYSKGEQYCIHRLLYAVEQGFLKLDKHMSVFLAESITAGHMHCFVRLAGVMPLDERLGWQAWLGADWLRSRADWMRYARGDAFPSLLIEPEPIRGFWREPDYICECTGKHKTEDKPDCEVWRKVRGASPWELFGKREDPEAYRRVVLTAGPLDLRKFRRIPKK